MSRDEQDPSGPLAWKKVEETFERVGLVLELEVGGRTIGTTAEHPFYVLGKGWTAAGELKPGDRIVGLDPRESVSVTALRLTGRQEKLYNLRVADYHTYFVGDAAWGFALWAHNEYNAPTNSPVPRLGSRGVDPAHHNANIMVRDASGRLRHHERIVSGNMTPEEQALGFPRNTLASHTEARAIRNIPLHRGETMIITGQRPPCPTCKGIMNQAARESGATIIYRWRENGVTRTWTAGN